MSDRAAFKDTTQNERYSQQFIILSLRLQREASLLKFMGGTNALSKG